MKRNNGFLDLNEYFRQIKNQNNWLNFQFLVKGIIEPSNYDDRHYWVNIDNEKYYFKPSNYPYDELVGYHIAKHLKIKATEYDLAQLDNDCHKTVTGVISKSYRKENATYVVATDLLGEYYENYPEVIKEMGLTDEWKEYYAGPNYIDMNNLEIIWQALEYRYRNRKDVNIEKLMDDIVNKYIFEILTRANDFGAQNWEIEESDDGVRICPLFDNELIFYDEPTTALSVAFEDNDKSIKESIKRFLNLSNQEYINKFIGLYQTFDLAALNKILADVEMQIQASIPEKIKERYIKCFLLNQKEINEVLEELNINKGR